MKATFIGHPSDRRDANGVVTFYGLTFPLNEPVDISHLDPKHQAKLRGNTHFRVTGESAPKAAPPIDATDVSDTPMSGNPSHLAQTAEAQAKREARAAKKAAKEQA